MRQKSKNFLIIKISWQRAAGRFAAVKYKGTRFKNKEKFLNVTKRSEN